MILLMDKYSALSVHVYLLLAKDDIPHVWIAFPAQNKH